LEGRRIAPGASPGRKVRTPQGAMLRNFCDFKFQIWDFRRYTQAESWKTFRRTVPQKIRPPLSASSEVRVKRCGKSAPREAQATRHGKPHRVQGQIGNRGAARSASAKADRFRVSVAQTNDSLRSQERRQNSAYSPSKTNLNFSFSAHLSRCPPANFFAAAKWRARLNFPSGPRRGEKWRWEFRC